jgi:hypothetical protein
MPMRAQRESDFGRASRRDVRGRRSAPTLPFLMIDRRDSRVRFRQCSASLKIDIENG